MRRYLAIILLLAILLIPGCLTSIGPAQYTQDYMSKLNHSYAIYNEADIEECKLGQCICLACTNQTSIFPFLKSYVGGSCRFVPDCTSSTLYGKMLNKSVESELKPYLPRQFMIGTGYSFSAFTAANGWCGNKLDMAVDWLVGDNDTPYSMPKADRAMCYIDKSVMPVYVLYSKGQNINATRAGEIAKELGTKGPSQSLILGSGGPVGPVVITTEIDFNSSDPIAVANVKQQINEINTYCKNNRPTEIYCFVALAPQMGDTNALNEFLSNSAISDQIDLVAFGINAHTVNLNDSYESTCKPSDVYQKALKFAKTSLYNYSKPTIIPYIMFDANGTDSSGRCNWTEEMMQEGYKTFFQTFMITFRNAGVIGAGAYDFNSSSFGTSPLNCSDCSIGKNNARMQAWFSNCLTYKKIRGNNIGDNPVVFSNGSGGTCDFSTNLAGILSTYTGNYGGSASVALPAANDSYIRCDACMNDAFSFPFEVPAVYVGEDYCTRYPEVLDYYADKRNLDPMLVRAVVYKESGFNPCIAAPVAAGGCNGKGYDFVPDPDGCPTNAARNTGTTTQYCGLGLMQVIEPPYDFWPAEFSPTGADGQWYDGEPYGAQLYKQAPRGDIAAAKSECSAKFNPYNVSDAACLGTYKLAQNLPKGEELVKQRESDLGVSGDTNKQRILAYYFDLYYYYGYTKKFSTWISEFSLQKGKTDSDCGSSYGINTCCGNKDFINFVHYCMANTDSDADYGWKVMQFYRGFAERCPNTGCPSCKKIYDATKGTGTPPLTTCTPPPMNQSRTLAGPILRP